MRSVKEIKKRKYENDIIDIFGISEEEFREKMVECAARISRLDSRGSVASAITFLEEYLGIGRYSPDILLKMSLFFKLLDNAIEHTIATLSMMMPPLQIPFGVGVEMVPAYKIYCPQTGGSVLDLVCKECIHKESCDSYKKGMRG